MDQYYAELLVITVDGYNVINLSLEKKESMLKELLFLITLVLKLIVPLVEVSENIWNIYNINEMIKEPARGWQELYI